MNSKIQNSSVSVSCMLWIAHLLLTGAETSKRIGYLLKNNCQSDLEPLSKFRLAGIISDSSYGKKNLIFRIFENFYEILWIALMNVSKF